MAQIAGERRNAKGQCMLLSCDVEGGVTILTLSGRVDGVTAPQIEGELVARIRDGVACIVIDCSDMNYLSSAGLRVFLMAARRCKRTGGALSLAALQPDCKSVVELGGFDTIIDCYDLREEAIASFASAS